MAAGTVISGGFPGLVAQEVQPNPKCNGCLHFDGQGGKTGICTIGTKPWNCGDGDHADTGYAPIARGAGKYLPDMNNHGAHAHEVDAQEVGGLYGAGSTRAVTFQQVSLSEEHVHFAKSMIAKHESLQKSMCRLCSMSSAIGIAPANVGPQVCTCEPIAARTVAKSLAGQLSNLQGELIDLDDLTDFVYAAAKSNFDPSIAKGTFYHAHGKYEVSPAGGGKHHVDFHPKGGGDKTRVGTFDSPRDARHATDVHSRRFASGTGADNAGSKPKSTHTPPGMPSMKDAVSVAKKSDGGEGSAPKISTITRDKSQFRLTGPDHVSTMHRTLSGAKAHAARGAAYYGTVRHIKDPSEAAKFHEHSEAAFRASRGVTKALSFKPHPEGGSHVAEGDHGTYEISAGPKGTHRVDYYTHGAGDHPTHTFHASSREGAIKQANTHHTSINAVRTPGQPAARKSLDETIAEIEAITKGGDLDGLLKELHEEEDIEKSLRWSHKSPGQAKTSHGTYHVTENEGGGHTVIYHHKASGKSYSKTFSSRREALGAVTEHHIKNRPPPKPRKKKDPNAPKKPKGAGGGPCPPCP